MNRLASICALIAMTLPGYVPAAEKSLASSIDVYVFPKSGQDSSQQSKDEAECYQWAVQNSGSDPFDLMKQQDANEQQAAAEKDAAQNTGKGAGARGAVGGAAAGALVGSIAGNDVGNSAAWGAAIGAVSSRRRGRAAQQQATAQAEAQDQQRTQATAEQIENFKKAFSVCLEAKEYLVKY